MVRVKQLVLSWLLLLVCAPAWASYTFDGTNDQLKGTLTTDRGDPLTLGCFVNDSPDGTADTYLQIGDTGTSNTNSYAIRTGASADQWRITSVDSGAAATQANVTGDFDNVWVGLLGVIATDSDRRIYISDVTTTSTNTATGTVVATLNNIAIGEDFADASDVSGLIAECAVWVGILEDAEITAYLSGTAAPFVADTEELIGYWPMDTDTGGTVPNEGTDTTGDLTASGNAAFNASHPTITGGDPPTFDAVLTETADTNTSLTFSYDASADADNLFTGLYRRGAADPTCAEVEAGTNAHGTATEATTGSADSITITTDDADPQAAYDAQGCLENESGYSALDSEDNVVMEPPAGETYFETDAAPGGGEISLFDGEATADNDYAHATLVVDCFVHGVGAHNVSYNADGTFTIDTEVDHPVTLLTLEWRFQDVSVGAWSDASLVIFGVNDLPPVWVDLPSETFPNGWLLPLGVSDEFPLDDLWSHPYNRALTHNINNLPSGFTEDGETLTVLPDTCGVFATPEFQAFDDIDQSESQVVTITVGAAVPDFAGNNAAVYDAEVEALCTLVGTQGAGVFSSTVPVGEVAAVSPAVGTVVEPDAVITYQLSLGPSQGRGKGKRLRGWLRGMRTY